MILYSMLVICDQEFWLSASRAIASRSEKPSERLSQLAMTFRFARLRLAYIDEDAGEAARMAIEN